MRQLIIFNRLFFKTISCLCFLFFFPSLSKVMVLNSLIIQILFIAFIFFLNIECRASSSSFQLLFSLSLPFFQNNRLSAVPITYKKYCGGFHHFKSQYQFQFKPWMKYIDKKEVMQKPHQQNWTFVQYVTPGIGMSFQAVEDELRDTFLLSFFQGITSQC